MRNPAVVVGTDGTACGTAAVEWAAGEARRRGAVLRIVLAYDWDLHDSRFAIGSEYADVARNLAETTVAAAHSRARALEPGIKIETDVLPGYAVPRLLEASTGAALLVVGSRGHGGFAGMLLGSVGRKMALQAPCPVVVVRGRNAPAGPVVAGLDDSDAMLATAFEAAAARETGLTVVRAVRPAVPLWLGVPAAAVPLPEDDDTERKQLAAQLAPWIEKYPRVPVTTVLSHDSAAAALVTASARAQLVVVGSHGHNNVSGALLGSTGLQLLHHAHCPVLIDRPA
ncbi:universal stress protein [Paractinoplanes atraurantiacus]|uniref:Nucleotide-binding universal stress protein, UspA family n=1 Tax=Paractinoplanes atraurantiacus TaxID=1036182 RepID=A0A285K0H6_9ACTN|nr:universal stress protein [Actinoplanes atraurantiacus]SNY66075.1 Nucleotide-binding universal stress protein, UspA family [Actinoplanes atraurantiacus]